MDIRQVKTKKAIKEAYFTLRKKHTPEKIKVSELCELAQINKTTFYRHYMDIIELAQVLENDLIDRFVGEIKEKIAELNDPHAFLEVFDVTMNQNQRNADDVHILFLDQIDVMFNKLEVALQAQYLGENYSLEEYTTFSFAVGGAFHVFKKNYKSGDKIDIDSVYEIVAGLMHKTLG